MQSPFPKNVREMAWRVQRMSALEATFGKDGENIIITELDTMYKVGLDPIENFTKSLSLTFY